MYREIDLETKVQNLQDRINALENEKSLAIINDARLALDVSTNNELSNTEEDELNELVHHDNELEIKRLEIERDKQKTVHKVIFIGMVAVLLEVIHNLFM